MCPSGSSRPQPIARAGRVLGERVRADRVELVPLELFGDVLLDDEHRAAHRAQRASRGPPSRRGEW